MKSCWRCKQEKPLTEFYRNRARQDGLSTCCKPCVRVLSAENYRRRSIPGGHKECRECGLVKTKDEFYSDKRKNGTGRVGTCKACLRVWHAQYRDENRAEIAERIKSFKSRNRDKIAAAGRAYYKANTEKCLAAARAWRQSKPHLQAEYRLRHKLEMEIATPKWADKDKIALVYRKAAEWGFQVDHVVPLRSKKVCGAPCLGEPSTLGPHAQRTKKQYRMAGPAMKENDHV